MKRLKRSPGVPPITETALRIGRKQLSFSNLDKQLYPSGFTKGQVIGYYRRVADAILSHLKGRAVTLKRYPDGSDKPFFFEKRCASHRPAWVKTRRITGSDGEVEHCLIDDTATLLWAANLAALELHVPLARATAPDRPTSMVFDLDPGPRRTLLDCARLGLQLRDVLQRLGLECFAKTSGGKGLHVYVPLNTPGVSFDDTKTLARSIATLFERRSPDKVTASMAKSRRAGRILIDWSQNDRHKTTVCVFSLRARERPTVSAPVTWQELEEAIEHRRWKGLILTAAEVMAKARRLAADFSAVLERNQRLPTL